MDTNILKIAGEIAGIGGLGLGVALLVFKDIIRKNIFPMLTREDAYSLLRLIAILSWSIAMLGVIAWVYTTRTDGSSKLPIPTFDTPVNDSTTAAQLERFINNNLGEVVHINTNMGAGLSKITDKGEGGEIAYLHVSTDSVEFNCALKGSEYELQFYKGDNRFSGYFVVNENPEQHMGVYYGLKAVSPETVILRPHQ